MDLNLGYFHRVKGVSVAENCVSVLDRNNYEHLIPIRPAYSPLLEVTGEFGDPHQAEDGSAIPGLELQSVVGVEVADLDRFEDFRTRLLRVRNKIGINFTWTLYCDENEPEPGS